MIHRNKLISNTIFHIILWVFLISNLYGCDSVKYISSKKHNIFLKSQFGTKYRIVKSRIRHSEQSEKFASITHCYYSANCNNPLSAENLMDIAIKFYPDYFSRDSSSLPIEITGVVTEDTMLIGVIGGITVFLSVGILPSLFGFSAEIDLNIKMADCKKLYKDSVEIEIVIWRSVLSPLGLIPIPGESDIEKDSGVMLNSNGLFSKFIQKSIVYSIVDTITTHSGT